MKVEITPKEHYLHVRAVGEFSVAGMKVMSLVIIAALVEHSSSKCLLDCRQVVGARTLAERFSWIEFAADESSKLPFASNRARIAYVGAANRLDPGRFGETVAINRGLNVMVTDSLDEALRWLDLQAD